MNTYIIIHNTGLQVIKEARNITDLTEANNMTVVCVIKVAKTTIDRLKKGIS